MKNKQNIIKIFGALSVITVILAGFSEVSELSDYGMLALFAVLAYVPFAILAYMTSKHPVHTTFFIIVGVLMIGFDLYAKYNAFFMSTSSTAGLAMAFMPIFLTGVVLVIWILYIIFAYFARINSGNK